MTNSSGVESQLNMHHFNHLCKQILELSTNGKKNTHAHTSKIQNICIYIFFRSSSMGMAGKKWESEKFRFSLTRWYIINMNSIILRPVLTFISILLMCFFYIEMQTMSIRFTFFLHIFVCCRTQKLTNSSKSPSLIHETGLTEEKKI